MKTVKQKTNSRIWHILLSVALVLIFSGCASVGPKYVYTQQQDSAYVEGSVVPWQGPNYGTCIIRIMRVDSLYANFDASFPGVYWPFPAERLYLSPGNHVLDLNIFEIDPVYGEHSGNSAGIIGTDGTNKNPTVKVEFMANRIYRFTANLASNRVELTLWDETEGFSTRSIVTNWTFDSPSNYAAGPARSGKVR